MLAVENVTVRFGEKLALDAVSLDVAAGEVVGVLGPSGSGKSTLLRVIAGLQHPDAGRVLLQGRDLAPVPPHERGVGLVFQDHALFDHRDVWGNVAFGLRMRGEASDLIDRRVRELLELVGLSGFERRSVSTLSGGEQQRVALARALAPEPRVLLLDEPLGSLDRPLRERLLADLERLFGELEVTGLYVTHDQAEAFALGDRVAIMRRGAIAQIGSPDELWARPASAEVARFLGQSVYAGAPVRPESVSARQTRRGETGDGVVESAARSGPVVRLVLRLDDGSTLESAMTALDHPKPGERVTVTIASEGVAELAAEGFRGHRAAASARRRHDGRVIRRRVIVHGHVQGVFFRDSVRRAALAAGVSGWVKNNRDGTVEAVFEGELDAVERVVSFSRAGPRGASVSSVDLAAEDPEGLRGFEIR